MLNHTSLIPSASLLLTSTRHIRGVLLSCSTPAPDATLMGVPVPVFSFNFLSQELVTGLHGHCQEIGQYKIGQISQDIECPTLTDFSDRFCRLVKPVTDRY